MIGINHVVSYLDYEGCHGLKIGFVFERSHFRKQGLSGCFNVV